MTTLRRRESWLAAAGLAALLAIAYSNVVFLGRSLVYSNNYNPINYTPSEANYGPAFVPFSEWLGKGLLPWANMRDPGAAWWQWEPGGVFLRRAILEGEGLFWDPYVGTGAPAMSNLTQAFFFPPYLLMVALGNTVFLKNVYFLLLLLSAGFFTYRLARRGGLGFASSLLAGAGYMLSSGLVQNAGSFIGQTAACIPVVAYATQRLLAPGSSPRRTAWVAILFAGVALASFPPLLIAAFGFATVYAAVRVARVVRRSAPIARRRAAHFAIAAALSLGLVAWYYAPSFLAMRSAPQIREVYETAGLEKLSPMVLFELLAPGLVGGHDIFASPPVPDPVGYPLPACGVVVLLLALVGILAAPRRRASTLWIVTAGLAFLVPLKILGVPPVQWIGYLPGLKSIHFALYYGIFLDFLLALLAGFGLEAVLSARASRLRGTAAVLLGAAALAALPWAIDRLRDPGGKEALWRGHLHFVLAVGILVSATVLWCAWRPVAVRGRRAVAAIVLGLLALVGVRNTWFPRQKAWDVWRNPPKYVPALASIAEGGRFFGIATLPPNGNSAYRIYGLDSFMTFNPARTYELYRRWARPKGRLFLVMAETIPPESVLDRANVTALAIRTQFAKPVAEAVSRGYESRFVDDYAHLFRRRSSPRYYFSSEYRVLSPDAALEEIGKLPPGREVLVERVPGFPAFPNQDDDPAVQVLALHHGSVSLRVVAPRPGLVYCSESDFPGWTAEVNGHPASILPANYAFRAIEVPSGDSVIELRYVPAGFRAGLAVSALSAVAAAILLLRARR